MIKPLQLFSLLTILFCLISCKKDDTTVNSTTNLQIVPLKVGNSWTMKRTTFDILGHSILTDTMVINISKDTVILGQTWYVSRLGIARNSADGLWILVTTASILAYKYPGSPNDVYVAVSNNCRIISTNELVQTPVGNMNCYHYLISPQSMPSFQQNVYIAPGVGWVSLDIPDNYSSDQWYIREHLDLLSYQLL